jgi:hypothetical protein
MPTPEMTVWPFLVSRNQVIDYHLLLAPPPLVQQKTFFDLLDVVRGSIPPDERLYWQTATIAPFGQVALVYRSLWATEALLGKGEDKQLTDFSKRPIKMYEGLLFESPFSSPPVVTAEDFSLLQQYTEVVFRDFWKAGRAASLLQSAPPFPLAQLTRVNPALLLLKPEESQSPPPPGQDVTMPSDGSGAKSGLAPTGPEFRKDEKGVSKQPVQEKEQRRNWLKTRISVPAETFTRIARKIETPLPERLRIFVISTKRRILIFVTSVFNQLRRCPQENNVRKRVILLVLLVMLAMLLITFLILRSLVRYPVK